MLEIKQYFPLRDLTTFKIGGPAKSYADVFSVEELQEALEAASRSYARILVIGGCSNVLISESGVDGMVVRYAAEGVDVEKQDAQNVELRVNAGTQWDEVVAFAVQNNFWGIENLSHIPGFSGAFVVQNVGAYGQEASQVVLEVQALELATGKLRKFSAAECKFDYRCSIFNSTEKNRWVILNILIRLSKTPKPNLSYLDLRKKFAEGVTPDLKEIRAAITEIRDAKFPYPYYPDAKGSAGSFFKNAVLNEREFSILEKNFEQAFPDKLEALREMGARAADKNRIKISSAMLIDVCGLKGLKNGGAKVNETQPLVILNQTGNATAGEVLELAAQVRLTVKQRTGLLLRFEPELIGFSEKELISYGLTPDEIKSYIR